MWIYERILNQFFFFNLNINISAAEVERYLITLFCYDKGAQLRQNKLSFGKLSLLF